MILRAWLALLLAVPAFAQIRVVPALQGSAAPSVSLFSAPAIAPTSFEPSLAPALTPSFLPAAAAPVPVVSAAVLPARTVLGLRDDADRLYAALAAIHSREKAGEISPALTELKRALIADFDGVLAKLPAADPDGAETRAAVQLRTARRMLSSESPVGPRALKRNAALWSLVGAHNSAAAAAAESSRAEALARGEEAFGDGRPYLVWNRWSNIHAELEQAALHARNGRPAEARKQLKTAAATLRLAGRDASDVSAASAFEALAQTPDSAAILAAKALVAHPELKTRAQVPYAELSASLRAQVHALESSRADYLDILERETSVRLAEALLSSPRPSAADKAKARAFLAAAAEWAGRGRVEAKRIAARNLAAAVDAVDRGDLALAVRHAGWTVDALVERRAELSRIALSVRRRLLHALSA
jgi:hypothetical protein